MPIEGPLRELGLPEVFQLLDLSRKTGVLHVTSPVREDEGHVFFESGRVVQASLRSKEAPALDGSSISEREMERRLRSHVEFTVYDMMAWREGSFRFEEREIADVPADRKVRIATESLLMESARRIDEWSRIADKIPHLKVVPVLAEVEAGHESQLNLLPHEWEVLSLIDGQRDLKTIAELHARDAFETAKVVYGLVTTGVVAIKPPRRVSVAVSQDGRDAGTLPLSARSTENPEVTAALDGGFSAARSGDFARARGQWERFLSLAPNHPSAPRVRVALDAVVTLAEAIEAHRRG